MASTAPVQVQTTVSFWEWIFSASLLHAVLKHGECHPFQRWICFFCLHSQIDAKKKPFLLRRLSCCLNIFVFRQKDDIPKTSIQFQTGGLVTDLTISDGPGNQHIHQLQFVCKFAFHGWISTLNVRSSWCDSIRLREHILQVMHRNWDFFLSENDTLNMICFGLLVFFNS